MYNEKWFLNGPLVSIKRPPVYLFIIFIKIPVLYIKAVKDANLKTSSLYFKYQSFEIRSFSCFGTVLKILSH